MSQNLSAEILSAMTQRDNAAYREQGQLAIALRCEARGADGSYFRRASVLAGTEKLEAQAAAQELFLLWLAYEAPAPAL